MTSSLLLALDAGGTHTRAAVVDPGSARCLGYGVAGGGNPTLVGVEAALSAMGTAAATALARSGAGPAGVGHLVLAGAGVRSVVTDADLAGAMSLTASARVERVGDLVGMYHSAAVEPQGISLVAGTGAGGARIRDGRVARSVDATGWLLGDAGSGFWIGRRIARAAVAHLDGRGPATALTRLLLDDLGLSPTSGSVEGRPAVLDSLMTRLYAQPPARLALLAPLAFRATTEAADPVAAVIVADAAAALARTLRTVRAGHRALPVVLGGSVLTKGLLGTGNADSPDTRAGPLCEELAGADVRRARDGVAGAAVVGLRRAGVEVTDATLRAMSADIEGRSS